MDADELALIEDTLVAAIAKAKIVAKARGVGPQFREIVRHAPRCTTFCATRFRAGGSQTTQRGLCIASGNAVDELELLDFLADGRFR